MAKIGGRLTSSPGDTTKVRHRTALAHAGGRGVARHGQQEAREGRIFGERGPGCSFRRTRCEISKAFLVGTGVLLARVLIVYRAPHEASNLPPRPVRRLRRRPLPAAHLFVDVAVPRRGWQANLLLAATDHLFFRLWVQRCQLGSPDRSGLHPAPVVMFPEAISMAEQRR